MSNTNTTAAEQDQEQAPFFRSRKFYDIQRVFFKGAQVDYGMYDKNQPLYKYIFTFKCENSNFDSSIIDNQELVDYLKEKGALNVPEKAIRDKQQLIDELKRRNVDEEEIKDALHCRYYKKWNED